MSAQPEIHKVETGAIITNKELVRPIKGYAKIFVQLSEDHEIDDIWNNVLQTLHAKIGYIFRHNLNYDAVMKDVLF